jgi:hypothetical protein
VVVFFRTPIFVVLKDRFEITDHINKTCSFYFQILLADEVQKQIQLPLETSLQSVHQDGRPQLGALGSSVARRDMQTRLSATAWGLGISEKWQNR